MTTYLLNNCSMDKNFFDNYVKQYVQKNLHKKCNNILDNDGIIECYSIGIESNRIACYSELFLLDINLNDGLYLPVFIKDINTSSYYALSRCNMDCDNEDNDLEVDINKIIDMCPKSTREQVNNILHNKV